MDSDDDTPDWLTPKKNKHICLPQPLLEDLKSDPDWAFERSMVLNLDDMDPGSRDTLLRCYVLEQGDQLLEADESWPEDEGEWSLRRQFYAGSNSTYLHFAARLGDVPFVHECIRLGVDINCRDVKGQTPLHFVMQEVTRFHYDLVGRRCSNSDASAVIAHLKRLRYIAKVLLEQHADPHLASHKDSLSPVRLAWYALDLELIELFALHGASDIITLPLDAAERVPANAPLWVANPENVVALKQLVSRLTKDGIPPRPPRQCPCWSGKPLSECHASGYHLYPPDFPCLCRAPKTYAKCCTRRNFEVLETWDHERKRMVVVRRVDDGHTVTYQNPYAIYKMMSSIRDEDAEKQKELVATVLEFNDALSEEKADPAFRYVLAKYKVLPRPMNKWFTKNLGKTLSDNWNTAVDEYIALGTDSRSTLAIEQAAKLDSDFGPLWKRCEASECTRVERPGLKMKCCSACKRTYYCSATCQKAAWKAHKPICKRRDYLPQALRSQEIYGGILDDVVQPLYEMGQEDSDLSDT